MGGGRGRGRDDHRPRTPRPEHRKATAAVPPIEPGVTRVIPLGGVEEVGKNMYVFEYGQDIIVVDAGFQFVGEEEAPGIDYILPNTKYLEDHKDKIRALVITHGHLDHIGGIPYLMDRMGNPPIYARELTTIMVKKRQTEFPHLPEITYNVIEPGQRVTFNDISLRFFPVTHSIPDSMGIVIETGNGNVIITGDLKLDHMDGVPSKSEEDKWNAVGKENNLLFIADSTNAEQPGFSIPEQTIHKNLETLIKEAPSRLIIGTFASQFERMIKIITICEKYNKKVVTEGRSIKTNIEVAQKAGLLMPKPDTIISAGEISNYPPDRIVVLATGAQGEEFAALMRIATKQHKFISLNERDTIILSSSIIPGNEIAVQKLKDNLYRHGCKIIHYRTSEVHSTGHANQEELAWINKKVGAKYFMPAFGYHSMIRVHAEVAERAGIPRPNIIIADNGMVIEFLPTTHDLRIRKERAPSDPVMVDGFSVGDVQEVVIRDRQMLAQDGIFVVIAAVDMQTGKVRKSPDIISRGFVYLRESQDLLRQARYITKKHIEDTTHGMHPINFEFVKKRITDDLGRFLLQQTAKRPIVLPVILGV
jgi:ribonuclease J